MQNYIFEDTNEIDGKLFRVLNVIKNFGHFVHFSTSRILLFAFSAKHSTLKLPYLNA